MRRDAIAVLVLHMTLQLLGLRGSLRNQFRMGTPRRSGLVDSILNFLVLLAVYLRVGLGAKRDLLRLGQHGLRLVRQEAQMVLPKISVNTCALAHIVHFHVRRNNVHGLHTRGLAKPRATDAGAFRARFTNGEITLPANTWADIAIATKDDMSTETRAGTSAATIGAAG